MNTSSAHRTVQKAAQSIDADMTMAENLRSQSVMRSRYALALLFTPSASFACMKLIAKPTTLIRRRYVVQQSQSAGMKVRSDEGHHAMKTSRAHRTVQKEAQSKPKWPCMIDRGVASFSR